jgi:Mlc titration factor MtfA (ptsG expression regulator)
MPLLLLLGICLLIVAGLPAQPIIGCGGLTVTDEARVTIAAQACLLLLNRPGHHFPKLRCVLVYPDAFIVHKVHAGADGVLQEQRQVLSGESWSQGQVILSWADALAGAAVPDDGRNVVLHEFAHQLDQETGTANGAPWMAGARRYERWSAVFGAEFQRLRAQVEADAPTLLNAYGATDAAEFFAVATEVFFEQPDLLAQESPDLYGELRSFYGVDPALW